MSIDALINMKREDILRIAAKHGAYNVRLFGSMARGQAGPTSDVDLLVDVGPGRTSFFPGGLIAELEDLLQRPVEVVTPNGLHRYIRDRVLQEAVTL